LVPNANRNVLLLYSTGPFSTTMNDVRLIPNLESLCILERYTYSSLVQRLKFMAERRSAIRGELRRT